MNFYEEWNNRLSDPAYMIKYLSKAEESREVLRSGTEIEVKFACDVLRKIRMEAYLEGLKHIKMDRLPKTEEIPQCGTLEKAICEVPQALAFSPDGLICVDLGLKLGAENHGDAPRKSGEGNGKMADAMDIAIRMKLPVDNQKKKYGYKLSTLGRYLLRFQKLEDKEDIVARLLIREYVAQILIGKSNQGYVSYDEVTAALKSPITRGRRRQNVRRVIRIIDDQLEEGNNYYDKIDWKIEG